jgi:hypothetical protein
MSILIFDKFNVIKHSLCIIVQDLRRAFRNAAFRNAVTNDVGDESGPSPALNWGASIIG